MFYEIEKLHYIISDTSEVDWYYIDQMDITPEKLVKIIDRYLSSLLPNHDLNGKDWYKLQGIARWIKDGNDLTNKQKRYALITMATNWNELNLIKITP
jgi:hypothetical protein